MTKRWNTEIFSDYVQEVFGDEFKVLGEYVNNNEKILMYHLKCNREFEVRPGNFKTRKRCSLCFGKFKKTTDDFKSEVFALVGTEYKVLGEYKHAKENIEMRHNKCDSSYKVTPTDFLSGGNRCPECAKNKKKNTQTFKEEIYILTGHEYEIIGEYITSKTPISIKHVSCGSTFEKTPELFLIGLRCPKYGLKRRSGENHYKYNPDLTKAERARRDMFNGEIRKWRDQIFTRDKYTCKKCGDFGGKLNAHHINSWDKHIDSRFDLKNGITLCEKCHKRFHSKYGYGNNTMDEFIEFLASL